MKLDFHLASATGATKQLSKIQKKSPRTFSSPSGHFFCLARYGNMPYIYGSMTYPMAAKEF
jgi:hypothetical protein